jgi:maltose O-acetyltransferase
MTQLYDPSEPERVQARARAGELLALYNRTSPGDPARPEILGQLFARAGPGIVIEPPFHCDYGSNIVVGERFMQRRLCLPRLRAGDDRDRVKPSDRMSNCSRPPPH